MKKTLQRLRWSWSVSVPPPLCAQRAGSGPGEGLRLSTASPLSAGERASSPGFSTLSGSSFSLLSKLSALLSGALFQRGAG